MEKKMVISYVIVNIIFFILMVGFFMLREFEIKAFGDTNMDFVYLVPVIFFWFYSPFLIFREKK